MAKKRILRVILLALVSIMISSSFIACKKNKGGTSEPEPEKPDAVVAISAESLVLEVGDSATLTISGTEASVEWSTRNESIATVSGGTVTAIGPGETWIIASVEGEGDFYCRVIVNVKNIAVPVIRLDGEERRDDGYSLNLIVGVKYTLRPYLVVGTDNPEVTFILTASEGIVVDGMSFTANAAIDDGKVTVSCEYGGETYKLEVAVTAEEVL